MVTLRPARRSSPLAAAHLASLSPPDVSSTPAPRSLRIPASAAMVAALAIAGCAAYGPPPPSAAPASVAPSGGAGSGAVSASPSRASRGVARAEAPAAESAPGGVDEVPAGERPGLGTEWGERRRSAVHRVSFDRDTSAPCAGAALHYNDAAGLSAMIDHDLERGAGMAPLRMGPRGEIGIYLTDGYDRPLPAAAVGRRTYVLGRSGERYSLVLVNHGPRRYEVVASVDGLDVLDGQDAAVQKPGYVLGPHARLRIDGFRTSLSEVAAFRFGRVQDSYAARTGPSRNVGVIGVALFCERRPAWPEPVLLPAPPTVPGEGETPDDDGIRRRQQAEPFPGSGFAAPPR